MVEVPRAQPRTFGEAIRQAREAKHLGLRAAARAAGITSGFFSDIENSNRMPSSRVLKRITAVLGISSRELERFDSRKDLKTLRRVLETRPEIARFLSALAVAYEQGRISYEELVRVTQRG